MSVDDPTLPERTLSSSAQRMRVHRKRRRRGMRCARIQVHVTEIDALIRKGYLDLNSRDDGDAVEAAIGAFVDDTLANEA
jgi:hypothetical protein